VTGFAIESAPQDTHFVVTRPVMWLFIAILVTFVVTRTITRHIRSRSEKAVHADVVARTTSGPIHDIVVGGVHIHHTVIGIFLMLGSGVAMIATTPVGDALNAAAIVFGVGVSLTFDEFALWLNLKDVYWQQQGQQSIDAIFCVLAATGALIGGADFLSGRPGSATWWISVAWLLVALACSVVCLFKGKVLTGVLGVFVPVVGWIGAVRVAKPDSWWARRRYPSDSRRRRRAERRFGPAYVARWNRLKDLVGGTPDPVPTPATHQDGSA
jgi:hypothetical protein